MGKLRGFQFTGCGKFTKSTKKEKASLMKGEDDDVTLSYEPACVEVMKHPAMKARLDFASNKFSSIAALVIENEVKKRVAEKEMKKKLEEQEVTKSLKEKYMKKRLEQNNTEADEDDDDGDDDEDGDDASTSTTTE